MTEHKDSFTDEERLQIEELKSKLSLLTENVLTQQDWNMVHQYLEKSTTQHGVSRDAFGLSNILTDMETALIVGQEMGLTRGSVLGVMLDSAVMRGDATLEDIKKDFGEEVAGIMHGLLRIRDLYEKSATIESENFRSLLVSMAEDMRVILIMIANRVCLMRNIKGTSNVEAQRKVSMESAYLYAPLAHKLGLYKLKSELEDLSLKYLEHDAYYYIKEKLNATKKSRDAYISRFTKPIEEKLLKAGLKFHMKGRTKSIHSIWQKMKKQKVDIDGVFDLFAIRIIIDSAPEREKQECWQVFSIITDMYQSNPSRMRDWLSVPKSNGYESLHITVLGPEQKWVEVQIRTERMDDIAEHGLAAHWRYKGIKGGQSGVEEWLAGVRSALESGDDHQLMDQFRMELTEDEVFVFTPKGDLFKLPAGATVLDFAYAIHTKVGNMCTGARIGNRNVTIRQKLASGDQVEILTSNNQTPKQDWLNIVTTSKARNKIKQTLKEMESRQASMAKEELERKMKNRKLDYDEPALMHTMTRMGYRVVTDFYNALAEGRLDTNAVLEAYATQLRRDRGEEDKATPAQSAQEFVMQANENLHKTNTAQEDVLVIDSNIRGLEFQMAKCCQPVYGDNVFGFVTSGGGIKIHRENCPNAPQLRERFGYRIVKAKWSGKGTGKYPITLHVIGHDDIGIVNNITSIISKEEKILLRSISIDSHDGLFSGTLTVMLEDTSKLENLLKKLKTVKGVKNVSRS
ncbi:MAG: RelA/SpoT family protein [Bacteroidaceae bacterium]|nr:bifunctional (p)ppGpp synthetase/guanosine-3',5'-bis(diphosphate) 3'-pyrophosphohydrolase [Bacteroidaceae bacterium]MCI7747022.1 RelA/SpoT family protein [Paraprevotella sp.]MDD5970638.1 RelA/SpoT family protein [Paraprevotella sp.]MDD6821449.1 RelA/SpoT family protein [Paraprevotella sp.]MDY3821001.1 RelA/SpoT family protein [Bacteroidaceae bacterium]